MMLGGGGGSQPIMVLSKSFFVWAKGNLRRCFFTDANTKRDQGKKAQFSNIFAAKVGICS